MQTLSVKGLQTLNGKKRVHVQQREPFFSAFPSWSSNDEQTRPRTFSSTLAVTEMTSALAISNKLPYRLRKEKSSIHNS